MVKMVNITKSLAIDLGQGFLITWSSQISPPNLWSVVEIKIKIKSMAIFFNAQVSLSSQDLGSEAKKKKLTYL